MPERKSPGYHRYHLSIPNSVLPTHVVLDYMIMYYDDLECRNRSEGITQTTSGRTTDFRDWIHRYYVAPLCEQLTRK
jgi:hypothetical protein